MHLPPPATNADWHVHALYIMDPVQSVHSEFSSQTQKGSNERLFIFTRTHIMQIFGEIPFVKPQNDTETTNKQLKTMKN